MIDFSLLDVSLTMVRDGMMDLPGFSWPDGYGYRAYRSGDEAHWARIETSAGEFSTEESALKGFWRAFGAYHSELSRRMFFLTDAQGTPVGTASAWLDDKPLGSEPDPTLGRLHWVAIHESHQNRRLSAPFVSRVLSEFSGLGHTRAYLTTQPPSYVAIKVYRQMGFIPLYTGAMDEVKGWEIVWEKIGRI